MTVTFRPAVRHNTHIMLGIAGPSRSGKTYSALRVATGLANGGPIFMIDTERGRALQYAEKFKFMHADLGAPFTSDRYKEAVLAAKAAGAEVCIIDSASHEHEGPGGILEQHEATLTKMAGTDFGKREKLKFTAWIKPKAAHNLYVNELLRIDMHMLFCFRAKDKLELRKNDSGKIEPVSVGWTPICTDRFEYEMTSMLILPEGARGKVDLRANSSGLREPIDKMIKDGQQLDENFGKQLASWAKGGTNAAPKQAVEPPATDEGQGAPAETVDAETGEIAQTPLENIQRRAEIVAKNRGLHELEEWFKQLTPEEKRLLRSDMPVYLAIKQAAQQTEGMRA